MSEVDATIVEVPNDNLPAGHGEADVTAGSLLRDAREAAGLHIAALAVALKVPVRKLEALEANQFNDLPDAVFVRALAASVCRTLKIDAAPVLQRLPSTAAPRLTQDDGGLNAPFRSASDTTGQSRLDSLSKPMVFAVLALLLGALVLIFLPTTKTGTDRTEVGAGKPSADAVSEKLTAPLPEPATALVPAIPAQSLPQPGVASGSRVAPLLANAAPATAAPASPAASSSVTSTTAPLPSGVLVLKTTAESWVEVIDAKGVVVLRRNLAAGEAVGANGALPIHVVVGRANVTSVVVRGKAFDLAPFTFDNVARFEVK